MVDKLRTELSDSSQRILSERRPEKTCRKKNPSRGKTRQEIWVGSMAHALESPPYEGYTTAWKVTAHYYKACIPRKHGKLE